MKVAYAHASQAVLEEASVHLACQVALPIWLAEALHTTAWRKSCPGSWE